MPSSGSGVPGATPYAEPAMAVASSSPSTMSGGASSRAVIESEPLPPISAAPRAQPEASTPVPAPPPVAAMTVKPVADKPEPVLVASAPAVEVSSSKRGRRKFIKPIDGTVLSGFGSQSGGLRNDGINIAASKGESVRAAQDGTVAYAGNELPGFGNLVLVKHADGWVTAYGHNDEIVVSKGQAVKQGQVIAKAGSTGNVSRPQVHFELRNGARAVDPSPYLSEGETQNAAAGLPPRG